MDETTNPPPGWYPHPGMAGTQGYWDGEQWTDQVAPAAHAAVAPASANLALLALGYVLAVLFPLGGVIVAAIIWRASNTQACLILALSGVSALIWFQLIA